MKGQISLAEQREYERQNASEHRANKVNNKENADVNGAEKAEEKSWVLFGFSPALRPRKGRKLLNQSPFDTGSTLSYLFLLDEGKIIHLPLCKIIWHSWFKNLRACSLAKQHFRKF